MTSRSRKFKSVRGGLSAVLLAVCICATTSAAYADDAVLPDPLTVTLAPTPPAPADTLPGEPAPVDPPPVDTAPGQPTDAAAPTDTTPPGETSPPAPELPEEPLPAAVLEAPGAAVVAPPVRRAPVQLPAREPGPEESSPIGAVTTPSASPSPSSMPDTPSSAAPAEGLPAASPPATGPAEIQAAVVAATGSPLSVQVVTVLILLGLGFVYFRFLSGKSRGLGAKAGK